MGECHATHCAQPATVDFSCRNHITRRWTSGGLYYCDEHGEALAALWAAQGMDTRLTRLGRS